MLAEALLVDARHRGRSASPPLQADNCSDQRLELGASAVPSSFDRGLVGDVLALATVAAKLPYIASPNISR
jgi:hypothetical protein